MHNNSFLAIRSRNTLASVRSDYIIALVPAVIWSIWRFGLNAIVLIALACVSGTATDAILKSIKLKKISLPSVYTLYTSLIFALILYSETHYLIAIIGATLTTLFIHLSGGEGRSLFFAPVVSRLFLICAFPIQFSVPTDLPASFFKAGILPDATTFDLILGTASGCIGTVSAMAVVVGGIYLLLVKHTNKLSPLAYILTVFLLFFFFPIIEGRGMESASFEILSSEILFICFFVLTDFSVFSLSAAARIAYGVFSGLLTFIFFRCGEVENACFLAVTISAAFTIAVNKLYFIIRYRKNEK